MRQSTIQQLLPAREGQRAVFVGRDKETGLVLFREYPLTMWALVNTRSLSFSEAPPVLNQEVHGMIADRQVEFAYEDPSFVGYIEPSEQASDLADMAQEVLKVLEEHPEESIDEDSH